MAAACCQPTIATADCCKHTDCLPKQVSIIIIIIIVSSIIQVS